MRMQVMVLLLAILISGFCSAFDLSTAKSQGLVGEQADGYLGIVSSTPEVEALVKQVNAQRKEAYNRIAQKNGTSAGKVAQLAGKKLFEKATANDYFRKPGGVWVMKSQINQ